ncbi:acetylornithine transaminase [Galactobacter valiniphilus]|uniref:acetylornithine transaminase n=1 Tax=Galactobacter valiniphilus TaxID=2676122 RepID=UPI003899565C
MNAQNTRHDDAGSLEVPVGAAAAALAGDGLAALSALRGEELLRRYDRSLLGVFGTPQRVLVRGSGATVWDADGKAYLDLLGGIAVNALGHAHPFLTSVVSSQLATLGHVSNFFASPTQIALAERLLTLANAPEGSHAFFANSGTEANEAAFKLARRNRGTAEAPRTRIIALEHSFHGRTAGALSMTWKPAYREPFEPLPGGVEWIPAGDVEALRAAVDETVQAVIVEPIQGEAGVLPLPEGYLQAVRDVTREAGALMIVDEVQTGIGRTGAWFASAGVIPDAMTLAKGLGGGVPIGAMLTFGPEVSALLSAGQHGTTFGGNPMATAAALATLHVIEHEGLLAHVRETGAWLAEELLTLDEVEGVHGRGLLVGIKVREGLAPLIVQAGLEAGFIVNATGPDTVRLAPPLIVTREQLSTFVQAFPALVASATATLAAQTTPKES